MFFIIMFYSVFYSQCNQLINVQQIAIVDYMYLMYLNVETY